MLGQVKTGSFRLSH